MALNRREKVLLSVPILLGGVISFYTWVHEPLAERRVRVHQEYEQIQQDLNRDGSRLNQEGDLAARVSAVTTREQTIDAWVPGVNSAALLIWYLSQAESSSGVRIQGITVGDRKQVEAEPSQGAQDTAQAPTGLMVVQFDLEVTGRFAQHLLFNQAVEQVPLFLTTKALSLERAEDLSSSKASGSSPPLFGTYQVNLHFKVPKPDPATTPMQFANDPGRTDPFAADGFVQSVVEYFASPR